MSLRDDLIKHQIALQRLAVTEANGIRELLRRLREQAKLLAKYNVPDNVVKVTLRALMAELPAQALQRLLDIAEYENRFSVKTINKYVEEQLTPATREALEKAITNKSIAVGARSESQGKKLTSAYKTYAQHKADEITQIIRDSRIKNVSPDDLINERVQGLQSTQALSLSVVAVNFVATQARSLVDKPMIWITMLDEGVCDYCEANHGELCDEVGYPPGHWGCRCHAEPQL